MREGLTGLASKSEETGLTGLGLKTRGRLGAVKVWVEGTWRHRRACIEAKRSRERGASVCGSYKRMDDFAPAWACILFNRVGVFQSFGGDLEHKKKGRASIQGGRLVPVTPSFSLSISLFSPPLLHLGRGI